LYSRGDHVHPIDTSRAALTQVVRYDTTQSLTAPQQAQARSNINVAGSMFVKQRLFISSGTYTPTPGTQSVIVECIGAGGGGGGCAGVTGVSVINGGGGGGGGAYARITLTAAQIGASQIVTVAPAVAASAAGFANGGNGGSTSFGTLCVASGGAGGLGVSGIAAYGTGGAGGATGTGDLAFAGEAGGGALYQSGSTGSIMAATNNGGASALGYGQGGRTTLPGFGSASGGGAGLGFGGGGGGAIFQNVSANAPGGPSAPGGVIVTEYGAT
jgi:hypothetical protein